MAENRVADNSEFTEFWYTEFFETEKFILVPGFPSNIRQLGYQRRSVGGKTSADNRGFTELPFRYIQEQKFDLDIIVVPDFPPNISHSIFHPSGLPSCEGWRII